MGERGCYQPLTKEDRFTVVLYRCGIVISALVIGLTAYLWSSIPPSGAASWPVSGGPAPAILLLMLYAGVGLSVFFIHLYVGRFARMLKRTYYVSLLCLIGLFIIGGGDPSAPLLVVRPISALLLIPLALCLGFVTAKEAFCFRLIEGYVIAVVLPLFTLFYASGILSRDAVTVGLLSISALLVLFVFRKVFMPIHYDIGDKSAYQP